LARVMAVLVSRRGRMCLRVRSRKKADLRMEEMWVEKEWSWSNVTPRLRASLDGGMTLLRKEMVGLMTLARCWGVPMIRNSVLDGLSVSLFVVNQQWRESRVSARTVRQVGDEEGEKDM